MEALALIAGLWFLSRVGGHRPRGPRPNLGEGFRIIETARSTAAQQQRLQLPSSLGFRQGMKAGSMARPGSGPGGGGSGGGTGGKQQQTP